MSKSHHIGACSMSKHFVVPSLRQRYIHLPLGLVQGGSTMCIVQAYEYRAGTTAWALIWVKPKKGLVATYDKVKIASCTARWDLEFLDDGHRLICRVICLPGPLHQSVLLPVPSASAKSSHSSRRCVAPERTFASIEHPSNLFTPINLPESRQNSTPRVGCGQRASKVAECTSSRSPGSPDRLSLGEFLLCA